jgi:hypothetical protein
MPPPQYQGRQNSCVGWAVAYALKTYQERLEGGYDVVRDGAIDQTRVFSPAFIYNQINQGRDGGSMFRDALNLVHEQGVASWADMPYDPSDYLRRPSADARARATRFRIDHWRQINGQDTVEVKSHVNAGYPVLIGASIDEGFESMRASAIWNSSGGRVLGGHAMVVVGYDDGRQAFKLLNSWGQDWGDRGYGWLSYTHFGRVVNEAYVAKDAINGPPPAPTPSPNPTPTPIPNPPAPPIPNPPSPPIPNPNPPSPPIPNPPSPPIPTPAPPVTRSPKFAITNVQHNTIFPDAPMAGYFMRFDGTLEIPPGAARANQVVISFWTNVNGAKGPPVRSTMTAFATVFGQAACGTATYPVPPEGLTTTWAAWIPYSALQLIPGNWVQTAGGIQYQPALHSLIAEPVLFLDGFGVANGGSLLLTVQR